MATWFLQFYVMLHSPYIVQPCILASMGQMRLVSMKTEDLGRYLAVTSFVCLKLMPNVPVNSYGHVKTLAPIST